MKKFNFIDHAHEIFTIGATLGVDIGVAYAMLKADVRSGERANTEAVDLGDFDVAAAHEAFAAMTEEEQKAAYGEWHDFVRRCYDAAVKVYPDRAGLDTLVDAYRAGEFDIPEEPGQEAAE